MAIRKFGSVAVFSGLCRGRAVAAISHIRVIFFAFFVF